MSSTEFQKRFRSEVDKNVLFNASFRELEVTIDVMTDQGVDTNFMQLNVLKEVIAEGHNTKATAIGPPHEYSRTESDTPIRCFKRIPMDIYLKIQHGSSLHLRKITMKIPEIRFLLSFFEHQPYNPSNVMKG